MSKNIQYVFGPVPSRRLGYSFGIDVIPFKTCTLDCVYCQLGRTTHKTLERREWVPTQQVIKEIRDVVARHPEIDYLTFSGSGEPTLHSQLGEIIIEVKKYCSIPIAVITNSTLFYEPDVRANLMPADLIVPSIDAVSTKVFNRLNRPHPDLRIDSILKGLATFSREYHGTLWIEIMIARGFNDTAEELECIAKKLEPVRFDKIHLNTVTRPPAESTVEPADEAAIELALDIFGERAEIIGSFEKEKIVLEQADIRQRIQALVTRHPESAAKISRVLGIAQDVVEENLRALVEEQKIVAVTHQGEQFYRCPEKT